VYSLISSSDYSTSAAALDEPEDTTAFTAASMTSPFAD
jgi:hypothetical protein